VRVQSPDAESGRNGMGKYVPASVNRKLNPGFCSTLAMIRPPFIQIGSSVLQTVGIAEASCEANSISVSIQRGGEDPTALRRLVESISGKQIRNID